MTPFEVYKNYLALKSHFTRESYDYFKYNGKVNTSVKAFEGRRDRFYFEKLAKHRDPTSFMLANILEDINVWVGELVTGEKSAARYSDWVKRNQSLTYNFKNELSKLNDDFDSNFKMSSAQHPNLLKLYLRKDISLETLIILVHMTGCFPTWNRKMEYDPVWRDIRMKIIKYQPFMKYDLKKYKSIVIDNFKER